MSESLPPDPFVPEDQAAFGKALWLLYTALVAGGFPEDKATELVKHYMTEMIIRNVQAG